MPWNPENKYFWDFWFARQGHQLHVFYLTAEHAKCAFNDRLKDNLSSVGHALLSPYGWRECAEDREFSAGAPGAWDDLSIWTGSIIEDEQSGRFYFFYTARTSTDIQIWTPSEYQRPQRIGLAHSTDLQFWERHPHFINKPIIDNPGPNGIFDGVAWRDPYVVKFGEKYLCLITARITPGSPDFESVQWDSGGCIVCLQSNSLTDWDLETTEIIVSSSDFYEMEVPQFFWRIEGNKKRYYLLFSSWAKGTSQKRRKEFSEEECQTGTYYTFSNIVDKDDWKIPFFQSNSQLLAANLYGGKIIEPESQQPLFFGFPMLDAAGHFMGGLSDPLKVDFLNNGKIEIGAF